MVKMLELELLNSVRVICGAGDVICAGIDGGNLSAAEDPV